MIAINKMKGKNIECFSILRKKQKYFLNTPLPFKKLKIYKAHFGNVLEIYPI